MKVNRMTAAISGIAVAGVAVTSGLGITHHHAVTSHQSSSVTSSVATVDLARKNAATHASGHKAAARPSSSADPSLGWLESPGGQAQVTFNDEVATLAGALEVENGSPTVANHLVFEADARVVRAEAQNILSTPSLLPTVNRAAYKQMLNDFIVVANLLQPGPGYGTTPQDWAAWNVAMNASNVNVS
jgi:hypothetical protein